jgi:hypothetical protein
MKFWINEPGILINKNYLYEIWPNEDMDLSQKLNAITRTIIILTILAYLIFQSPSILFSGFCTILIITAYYFYKNNQKNNKHLKEGMTGDISSIIDTFKPITSKNPMNNVMIHEINEDPNRKSAPPAFNKTIEYNINNATKNSILEINADHTDLDQKLFKDLGDNYMFDNSMRSFHSNPSTTIPNDQAAFASYCYGNMASCKTGDAEMCMKHNIRYNNY